LGLKKSSKIAQREINRLAQVEKSEAKRKRKEEAEKLMHTADNSNNVAIPNYLYD